MRYISLIALIALSACATPVTVLKNAKGDVATCGGGTAGSLAGGLIGYKIQESNDADCVAGYAKRGFKPEAVKAE